MVKWGRNILICTGCWVLAGYSCKKKTAPAPEPEVPVVVEPAVDPPVATTAGFFLDEWKPKTFTVPPAVAVNPPSAAIYTISVDRSRVMSKISPALFGNNANLWMTQVTDQPVLMDHLKKLSPSVIRFPGGSISDVFFWNADKDMPPADAPSTFVKADGTSEGAGFWYGNNSDAWTFSVSNYYQLLQQTNSKGLITVNYGYARYGTGADPVAAAAHLAAEWVRFDNGRTMYWEIGNENFGDWEAGYRIATASNRDGQPEFISGQLYGQHFKVFADSMRKAATAIGKQIYIGAVMVEAQSESWATATHRNWNTGLLGSIGNSADYYVLHNYYTAFQTNASAAEILATPVTETGKMVDFVKTTFATNAAALKPLVLDEWNIFSTGSKQQVSHVNGMHAVLVLGEAMKQQLGLTARWDIANGWDNGNDHGMFSQGEAASGETKWLPRPAFYQMYFFQKTAGDRLIESTHSIPGTMVYATSFSSGETALAIVNTSTASYTTKIDIKNFIKGDKYYWYTLTGDNDNGEFSRKVIVNGNNPEGIAGGPAAYSTLAARSAPAGSDIKIEVPARATVFIVVDNK